MADFGTITIYGIFLLATWSGALALVGQARRAPSLVAAARVSTYATAAMASLAILILSYVFAVSDFSVQYVQHYSDRTMPLFFKLTAVWGGQAGSLLFWAWLLAVLSAWAVHINRDRLRELIPWVIVVLMVTLDFFCLLMLLAGSNPFEMFLGVVPLTGKGLNPLLQNAYMVTHPPALYVGYVGMAIPFALAMAALITGQTDESWLSAARPFAIGAWYFLSMGLVLGMLWAYEELGWGGYWGWDPVENAGLIPWLTSTAYIHSVMVQERRQMLKIWNVVLALLTFELTIFGTFLTRSGFIDSVHAFAKSDIGWYFLAFMGVVASVSLALILWRRPLLRSRGDLESVLSREFFFVLNNWVLLSAAFLVLVLTVFPNISQLFGNKITISAPAFNRWMVPIGLALLAFTGIGPMIGWKRSTPRGLRHQFMAPGILMLLVVAALAAGGMRSPLPLVTLGMVAFVLSTVLQELARGVASRRRRTGQDPLSSLVGLVRGNRRRYGGYLVHTGMVLMYLGFAGEAFKQESEVQLARGQQVTVADYTLRFEGVDRSVDDQKQMVTANLTASKDGKPIGVLQPARWVYFKHQDQPTTEVAIRRSVREDLFVALGDQDTSGGTATFKVVVNPLVNWIWLGFVVLTLGALVAVFPERLRRPADLRPAAATLAALVLCALLASPAAARAAEGTEGHDSQGTGKPLVFSSDKEHSLLNRLACMCPTCPRIPLASCQCGFAGKERAAIRQKLNEGWDEARVVKWYTEDRGPELGKAAFGQEALTTPPDSAVNRLSWLLPYLLSGIMAVVLLGAGLRWSRSGRKAAAAAGEAAGSPGPGATGEVREDATYDELLDHELRKMD